MCKIMAMLQTHFQLYVIYYDVTNILRMNRSLNLIDNKDESDCIEMSLNRIENQKIERKRKSCKVTLFWLLYGKVENIKD